MITLLASTLLSSNWLDANTPASMFRGDPAHSGIYDSPIPDKLPKVLWKFRTGGKILGSPAVYGGDVYFGSNDSTLYAVNQATGKLRWKAVLGIRITSSPAVHNDTIFLMSYSGRFLALNTSDGKVKWRFQTEGERRFAAPGIHGTAPTKMMMADPFDFYLSSPIVADGIVYFGCGDGYVYAVSEDKGELKWKFKTGDVVHASPAVVNGMVYIGSWDRNFYALDAKTGAKRWSYQTGDDKEIYNQIGIQGSATVANGLVYFGCRDSFFYALDAMTGDKVWTFNNKTPWVIGTPVVQNGKVYFSTSDSALLRAHDAKTGAEAGAIDFRWPMFSSPAVSGNRLVIGSHSGKLYAVDLVSFSKLWEFSTDGAKANLAKFSKQDGKFDAEKAYTDGFYDDIILGLDRMFTVGSILSSPVISNGVIYFGSTDGNLYAIK